MTVVDDNMDENQYWKLKFVEMFEFLARFATLARLRLLPKAKQQQEGVLPEEPEPYEGP